MIRLRMRDLALVAFAGGLLAIEVVGLRAAAPTVLRTLAGVSGIQSLQAASHGARAATSSVLDGVGVAAAEAASGVVKRATGYADATPTLAWNTSSQHGRIVRSGSCQGFKYVMVVGDDAALNRALRLVAVRQREIARAARIEARRVRSEIRATSGSCSHSTSESTSESSAETVAEAAVKASSF